MLVDSHCHLDFKDFAEEGIAEVVNRANAASVDHMVTISIKVSEFDKVKSVAESFDCIDCTVGTHPHYASEIAEQSVTKEQLIKLSQHPKVIGIGETGLDYYYDYAVHEDQKKSLSKHIEVCLETGLPIIIHSRDADEDMARILKEEGQGQLTGVMHCFSSSQALAEAALDLGFYISLSGIVTFKKSDELRDIARNVPLDKILVETDSPYLAPMPNRGKRNEPAFVVDTARKVAEIKEVSEEELAQITTDNFYRLFTKAERK